MEVFAKIVQQGKDNVTREYKKLIRFVKLMVEKLSVYSPIKTTDIEAVFETIVDPQCIASRCVLHGTKTGNSKEIQRVEERQWKVEQSIKDRELMTEEQVQTFTDTMELKSNL